MSEDSQLNFNRVFASFGGKCPFKCNHCYTFIDDFSVKNNKSINDIINELKSQEKFDIVYISGFKENFIEVKKGIDLIEAIYAEFKCNILFTTRNVFSYDDIVKLSNINKTMKKDFKYLFACVSISAYNSYKKLESCNLIPSPQKRIDFIKQLFINNIITFLTLRPICPSEFIPTQEYLEIVEQTYKYCNGVISSGIVVNHEILLKLKEFPKNFKYKNKNLMDCLNQNDILMKYVNVDSELIEIKKSCISKKLPFYSESKLAIFDYIGKNHLQINI